MLTNDQKRDVFDFFTGEPLGKVREEIFEIYLDQLQEGNDEIGVVRGDDWGFPGQTIFMW